AALQAAEIKVIKGVCWFFRPLCYIHSASCKNSPAVIGGAIFYRCGLFSFSRPRARLAAVLGRLLAYRIVGCHKRPLIQLFLTLTIALFRARQTGYREFNTVKSREYTMKTQRLAKCFAIAMLAAA